MTFNPLSIILKQNQLTGPNYTDWKRNLDIVLTGEGYKYVLFEECSVLPEVDPSQEEIEAYKKWQKANEMARYYIMSSMSNILQQQHLAMESVYDIMCNLKELFGHQS